MCFMAENILTTEQFKAYFLKSTFLKKAGARRLSYLGFCGDIQRVAAGEQNNNRPHTKLSPSITAN